MRVLLVTANFLPYLEYGAERAVRLLGQALAAAGHRVRVVTTCPAGEERTGKVDDLDVDYVALRNLYWTPDREHKTTVEKVAWHIRDTRNPDMGAALGRVYDAWQPDVVHTHILAGFSVNAWLSAAARGIPVVHTLHDRYLFCPTSTMFHGGRACTSHCWQCRPFSLPRRWASAAVAGVTSPSQATLDAHTAHGFFPRARCKAAIPNVIDIAPASPAVPRTRSDVLGYIGRLSIEKGVPLLLGSIRSIPASVFRRIVFAGSGPLEADVRRIAADDPRVTFIGYQNPAEFFRRIDALVVPSICHDTSPNVIREAYAHGVPVVGSQLGGIPELIRMVDERLVFDQRDPDSLARAIATALDPAWWPSLCTRASAAASTFTTARTVGEMTRVYQQAMSHG